MNTPASEHAAAARRALQSGDLAKAVEHAQSALRIDGGLLDAMLSLAVALHAAGQRDDALEVLTRAVSLHPSSWQAHFQMAQTLHTKTADHARARAAYECVLELNPSFAGTHAALAKLCEEVNDLAGARTHADRAVELAPDDPSCILAAALIDRRTGDHGAALARLRPLLGDEASAARLAPLTRALAFRSLGQSLDATGAPAEARDAFARAHAERWSMPDAQRIDAERALHAAEASRRALTPANLAAWGAEAGVPSPGDPVFLVGFPRSGTTLTEQILASHPGVVTLDEDSPLTDVARVLAPRSSSGFAVEALAGLAPEERRELRSLYERGAEERLARAGSGAQDGRLLIDKLPLNIVQLPLIARVFPASRVIAALRDPRDACVSCLSQVMTPNAEMAHLRSIESAARYYARVMSLWLESREHLPNPHFESRYEDLVADPERAIRRLVGFLDLPWDDAVLHHDEHAKGKPISTPSYEAVASPITPGAAGRWRRHAEAFEGVGDSLDPFLDAFGYDR